MSDKSLTHPLPLIALVNGFDMRDDAAQRYHAPAIGLRGLTNIGEPQVPGYLAGELWGDAGRTAGYDPPDARYDDQLT